MYNSKKYSDAGKVIQDALNQYVNEVKTAQFPTADNSTQMSQDIIDEIHRLWR